MKKFLLLIIIFSFHYGYCLTAGDTVLNINDTFISNKKSTVLGIDSNSKANNNSYKFYNDSTKKFEPGNKWFPFNKKREKAIILGQIIGYATNFATLYNYWYKDYPQSKFHFFNDNEEYLQVDKVSHMFGAYTGGRISMQFWKWAGVPKKKYVWIGGMTGLYYETVIEVMDGFSENWGFSWGDYVANVTGAGLLVGQELLWDEQRILVKYGTHLAQYNDPVVNNYLNRIYGKSTTTRLFKDYNPQTYWLSANIKSFFKKSNLPDWLNVAVGYGGEDMMGANWDGILKPDPANPGKEIEATEYHFQRYRQWYLAPDIDFTRIKTKSKILKTVFFALNFLKFPTPSLEFSQGRFKWNWIHF